MAHTVTAKLNKAARKHQGQNGTTFFVSLGEKNYNFSSKESEWTNYEAALFAKDGQVAFYEQVLIEGAVIEVSGTGIILDTSNPEYKPKLILQDAKLGFTHSPQQAQGGYQQQPQQQYQQQPQQQQQQPQQMQQQQQNGYQQAQQQPQQQGNNFNNDVPF